MVDLSLEVEKRKTWFHECHLRRLNLDSFRGVTELDRQKTARDPFPDNRISLISEPLMTWSFGSRPIGGELKNAGQVYLNDQEPVWTSDENARRGKLEEGYIGRIDNWLGYKDGRRLSASLNDLRQKYEQSAFSSITDLGEDFTTFARSDPGAEAGGDVSIGRAISRAELANAKPWLIGELYSAKNKDPRPLENWLGNIEAFLDNFESDLSIAVGGSPTKPVGDAFDGEAYRAFIRSLLEVAPSRDTSESLKVKIMEEKENPDKSTTFVKGFRVQTAGYPLGPLDQYPLSENLKYWVGVVKNSLSEVYVNKPNADMGLCHILRVIYLYGTLPQAFGSDADLTWRKRPAPDQDFQKFFDLRLSDPSLKDRPELLDRLQKAKARLGILLEESASHPRSPAPMFSPLAQEVVRQGLHSFKFWLDQSPQVKNVDKLLRARKESGIVSNKGELEAEMEYWSENHYIMFASSEFLVGQLWESDKFHACKEFLPADDKSGILTGKQHKERGRARVLKYLNNKLLFGWTEFNSSGYYREHLWSILNLADFSLDKEIREKAALVVDLMLFDIGRFLHKGTMGAAGGRSQFKSKGSGFDNAVCDVVEILWGSRDVFSDGDSQIGAALATSTYKPPEVLLEIGSNPPDFAFTDRSRVSITFEEAPRYGIGYSQDSDQKDSVMQGYAPKRAQYFAFVDRVNQAIAQSHANYGATEDDTIFWWGTSAYYCHQTVRGTFAAVNTFGLEKSPIFGGTVPLLIKLLAGYEKVKHRSILGGIIGGVFGNVGLGAVVGAGEALAEDFGEVIFKDDSLMKTLEEAASDDLSVLVEGSVRTRVNLFAYRSPAIMLGNIQNFRAGQLNFQSSVCQASINPSLNVFTTAGLDEIDISDLEAAFGGGLAGGLLAGAVQIVSGGVGGVVLPAIVGAIGGVVANRLAAPTLADHGDGPGWWTGSWSLPMAVQHGPAVILAYDFHFIQSLLAECGSHAWFPKSGFDRVDEMRTSAYDDANFPLLDIGDIGPKGFWVFGKYVHSMKPGSQQRMEAYIGVFSNQRPVWLDQDSDFYKEQIKNVVRDPIDRAQDDIDNALDAIEDDIGGTGRDFIKGYVDQAVQDVSHENISQDDWNTAANDALSKLTDVLVQSNLDKAKAVANAEINLKVLQRVWPDPLPQDYFAGRDWYVDGKNVWIIQVGSSDEFADFQEFKESVSKARIHLDDAGDLECSYDVQLGGGKSERLTLAYGDGGKFGLNGGSFQTDLYPRFENPFLRGGRVEWGQREYILEYNGKSLLHDFTDFENPVRLEQPKPGEDERSLVKALVIFVKTGDEDMDAFTVATADVTICCEFVTKDQVIAAGPVDEDTYHDAEWIFFDFPAPRQPDMSIVLTHPASTDGDDTPHWKMSFQLFALMGDRILRPCNVSGTYCEFEDDHRTSPVFAFSIPLLEWRPWTVISNHKSSAFWRIARQADSSLGHYDYTDLLAVDIDDHLWHRRLMACPSEDMGWFAATRGLAGGTPEPDLTQRFFMAAVSAYPGALYVAVQSQGTLFANRPIPAFQWFEPWTKIDVWVYPDGIFGLPNEAGAPIPVPLSNFTPVVGIAYSNEIELTLLAADGHLYSRITALPQDIGAWRKIEVSGFTPMFGVDFVVDGDSLFILASDGTLWAITVDHSVSHLFPAWEQLLLPRIPFSRFRAVGRQIVASTHEGTIWVMSWQPGIPASWIPRNLPNTTLASTIDGIAFSDHEARFVAIGADSRVYSLDSDSNSGWALWSELAPDGKGLDALASGGIAALSRVTGQVEVYAQTKNNAINKAWWS